MKKIELKLKRIADKPRYTIGKLYIKREEKIQSDAVTDCPLITKTKWEYLCDTLERPLPNPSPLGRGSRTNVAIPAGTYPIVITWSPTFKCWLPLLMGVPNRSGIRIHAGNFPSDTRGCILVGENKAKGQVWNSKKTLKGLMAELVQEGPDYKPICITIE